MISFSRITAILAVLLSLSVSVSVSATERAVWDKTPIKVVLQPKGERLIEFPYKNVRAKIPAEIRDKVSVLSNNGILYITSSEEFTEQRVLVQDKKSEQIIILSLSSSADKGSNEELTILLADSEAEAVEVSSSSAGSDDSPQLGYEDLIRMAAKHLYAPSRLITVPANTRRVHIKRTVDTRLIRGSVIEAEPAISFNHEGLHVTAVKLTNQEARKIVLDPRDIRGDWLAASFQHVVLGPKGAETDTTALYVVSNRPFWESH